MASNYGLGIMGGLNLGLNDIRDLKINANTKIGRNHNKDYVLRYKNSDVDGASHFVMVPASVQQHDHPVASLVELGDVDSVSIGATAAANDATPFAFSWDKNTSKFQPYNIPRNIVELLGSKVAGGEAGVPKVLFYDSNVNQFKMQDLRPYLPRENPSVKLIGIPLHLKIDQMRTIMKAGNQLERLINCGEWYCSYNVTVGSVGLFYDTQLHVLGLKAGDDAATLTLQAASRQMTDTLKILRKGTLFIKCIKLSTSGEYDEFIDTIAIKAESRVKCAIVINIDEKRRDLDISFIGDQNVSDNLSAVIGQQNKHNLDIGTIKLKRIVILDVKYFPEILSSEEITNLLNI